LALNREEDWILLVGEDIKDFLIREIDRKGAQTGISSHWRKYLETFSFSAMDGLKGLQGFGNISRVNWEARLCHKIMQLPYRRKARFFEGFESILLEAQKIADIQNRLLNLDMLRQALTLAFCQEMIPEFNANSSEICVVIGDGFGVLASLILSCTNSRVVSINLNEILLVDYIYTRGSIDEKNTVLINTEKDIDGVLNDTNARLMYIQAENHFILQKLPIFIAFNSASMQEMDPPIIAQYFSDLRNCRSESVYFYCCNRIKKTMPDGTVTSFFEYPWSESDEILVDELCPWHQYYYSLRFPFFHKFDGPTQHRLARLSSL
jgi:hypothetical protein